ncbi:ERF family protein [Geobacillus stearothermophilus]|uniref:ERF family protein n=1 Tax=Geobacillus stearothermophilus TaxID=1422 RepID=UPI002E2334A9|nr:ERF family protein [Geobacillus stearothermophilus]
MNRSDSIANIAAALCQFQAECPAPKKTATNPHFQSKYSPLEEIVTTIKPYLAKHGLSFFQSTTTEGDYICVTTLLLHVSGEYIESDPLKLPMGKVTAQGAGSAVTYARRYSLCAALGIAAEDDDDANAAEAGVSQKASEKQLNYIDNLLNKKASDKYPKQVLYERLKEQMGVTHDMEDWTVEEASRAISILTGKGNGK